MSACHASRISPRTRHSLQVRAISYTMATSIHSAVCHSWKCNVHRGGREWRRVCRLCSSHGTPPPNSLRAGNKSTPTLPCADGTFYTGAVRIQCYIVLGFTFYLCRGAFPPLGSCAPGFTYTAVVATVPYMFRPRQAVVYTRAAAVLYIHTYSAHKRDGSQSNISRRRQNNRTTKTYEYIT